MLGSHLGDAQAGAMSIRPRYVGDCAAAGWTTLGAGRRAAVGGLCAPEVQDGKVTDWPARQAAAAARRGDAQLGTLAGSVKGCVAAVGPGAALAAAKPDGTVTGYQSPEEFVATGMKTTCPITIVDAGPLSDQIITQLANRKDITLIVTGVGPNPGSDDPSLQVVYRLGTTLPGWLTSASTRRDGIVTLPDLTRTLIEFGGPTSSSVAVDGSPFAVYDANLTVDGIDAKLSSIAALSDAAPIGYLALGLAGAVMVVIMVFWVVRGKFELPKLILTLGGVLAAAMMLTGAVPWQYSDSPGAVSQRPGGPLAGDLDTAGAPGRAAGRRTQYHRRDGNHRCRIHRRRGTGRGHAAGLDAQLTPDLRPALVRIRKCDLRRVRQRRAASRGLRRPSLPCCRPARGRRRGGQCDRLWHRDL